VELNCGKRVTGAPDARFVIDATGRTAAIARAAGARVVADDHLTAFVCWLESREDDDPRTVVEKVDEGWWYTAALDGGTRVAAFLSETRCEPARWHEYLTRTRYVSRYRGRVLAGPTVRAANSQHLEPVCGSDWLAAGDAAMALDPLSGQGIVAALRCGIFAGYAAGDWLSRRNKAALVRYRRFIAVALKNYQRVRRRYYDLVRS
jgi:flavin-dependent dehydrogenase